MKFIWKKFDKKFLRNFEKGNFEGLIQFSTIYTVNRTSEYFKMAQVIDNRLGILNE